mmetsp:Transcript_21187/g.41413  ORF Transcript_21187/g.41413 Transcript_21187/m.41413 type:complete len:217 (+) Transcript_21187:151-801(+)
MSLMPCNMMELCSCTSSRDNEVGVASADNCTNAHGCAVSAGSAASDGAAPTKCRTAAGAVVAGTVCAADVSQTATSASALLFSTAASSASNMPRHSACSWPKQRSSWSNRRERRANRSLQRKVFGVRPSSNRIRKPSISASARSCWRPWCRMLALSIFRISSSCSPMRAMRSTRLPVMAQAAPAHHEQEERIVLSSGIVLAASPAGPPSLHKPSRQ